MRMFDESGNSVRPLAGADGSQSIGAATIPTTIPTAGTLGALWMTRDRRLVTAPTELMVADNWIAANGAVLDGARTPAYTKLSGAVWNTSSNWAIASNRMSVTDVGAGKSIHVKTAFQDGIVDATIHATAVAAGSLGVLFRYLDTDNFWAFYMAASTGDLYLYRKNAGAGVVVGTGTSTTVTAGLSYDMRVVFAGTQIFAFLDGELIYNYTDATAGNLNRTCHGLYSAGGATGDLHCDSWHFAGWV